MSKIFPLIDHLYIYQLFEYNSLDFLKWFVKYPFKRNLQRKHTLVWTSKAKLLTVISLILIFAESLRVSFKISGEFWLTPLTFFIVAFFSPFFLIISKILIWPLEYYQRQKILAAAKSKLEKLPNLKVVGITGSYGKTSTKDILYTLLWKKFRVVKTPKSFNTPLGVTNTLIEDVKDNTDIFIAEIGAYKRGEIKNIAKLVKPTIGIITAISPQHLERFGSLENIAKAKFELVESLPKNGLAILNGESELLVKLSNTHFHPPGGRTIFYGRSGDKYFVTDIKSTDHGSTFLMHTPKGKIQVEIPLVGEHHIKNFLAASAAALNLGLTLNEIQQRTLKLLPTSHRMEIKQIGNIILIDNSYNTNPESAKSSLDLLNSYDTRKIVITPGFVELGREAPEANRQFGEEIACMADEVIIIGENAKEDLLEGINKVWPDEPEYSTHLVQTTNEALILAQKLAADFMEISGRNDPTAVLLENDLPDQYF